MTFEHFLTIAIDNAVLGYALVCGSLGLSLLISGIKEMAERKNNFYK